MNADRRGFHSGGSRRFAVAILCLAAAAVVAPGCRALRPAAPPGVAVERVERFGELTTNALSYGRDAGNSVRMGSDILWVFGDTFSWSGMVSASAAWSDVEHPTRLSEPVDEWFGALPFYEMSDAERLFNETRDPPACCDDHRGCAPGRMYCRCPQSTDCATRIALWPGDLIDIDGSQAVHYYEKVLVGSAPFDFQHLGTGIAIVERGSTRAIRPVDACGRPRMLFGPDEPNFLRAVPASEEGRRYVYVYAAADRRGCTVDVLLARVRLWAVFERAAYRFWDGSGWSSRLEDAVPVLDDVTGGLGSVGWNEHLDAYLSAFNDICSGGTALLLRTAPRPEGPWSDVTRVDLKPLGATEDAYAGQIHTSLGDGRSVVFSFYQPQELGIGRIRLGRLTLQ